MTEPSEESYWLYEAFANIWSTALRELELRKVETSWFGDFLRDLGRYSFISWEDVSLVVLIAVTLTLLRASLTSYVFTPLANYLVLSKRNRERFPESCFKAIFYTSSWLYTFYILFGLDYEYFSRPITVWTGWYRGMPVPFHIYVLYAIQCGFYFHSVYGVLFLDARRKDTVLMTLHHILTISLIGFSFAVRYVSIGVLVLFLHDLADICLEYGKIAMYVRRCGGKYYAMVDHFSTFMFICFSTWWFVCRLYLYPHKVLHSAGHLCVFIHPTGPFYFFFNFMLWVLFLFNIYWFHFIIIAAVRIMCGTSLNDTREELDEDEPTTNQSKVEAAAQQSQTAAKEKFKNLDEDDPSAWLLEYASSVNSAPPGHKVLLSESPEDLAAGKSASQRVNRRLRQQENQE